MKKIPLGQIIELAQVKRAGKDSFPILSMTMRGGLVDQADKFSKRIASADTATYKVVDRGQLVVGFPIDEGVLAFQRLYDAGIVSPAYNIWDVRENISVNRKYLERFLRSPLAITYYKSKLRNTTARRRSLPNDIFQALPVPLPPIAEQERIVNLLDEADEIRKLRSQADDRTTESIPALFHEMFGDPDTNPKKLPIVTLGTLLQFRTGKLDSNAAVEGGAYPFFTCSREDFRINSYAFDCEALLLAGNNATADYSVKHYKGKFNAYQRTYVLNLLNREHSYGFMQQAMELRLRELKRVSLGTGTKYLTLDILKKIKIPLPTSVLQAEFAKKVLEIREFQTKQAAGRQRLDDLFRSMLHRAFSGEL